MYRNNSFDEHLYSELQDIEFAKGFLLALMEGEDGLSIEEALRVTIQKMGVPEFCDRADLRITNVNDFLKKRRRLKLQSLDMFLKPFRLKTKVVLEDVG